MPHFHQGDAHRALNRLHTPDARADHLEARARNRLHTAPPPRVIEIGDVTAGIAVPERGGVRFFSSERDFDPLDGLVFASVEKAAKAARDRFAARSRAAQAGRLAPPRSCPGRRGLRHPSGPRTGAEPSLPSKAAVPARTPVPERPSHPSPVLLGGVVALRRLRRSARASSAALANPVAMAIFCRAQRALAAELVGPVEPQGEIMLVKTDADPVSEE